MADIYQLALSKIYGIGPKSAVAIIKSMGSAQALFEESEKNLRLIFKTREKTVSDILSRRMFDVCEKEMEFMQKYGIKSYFFTDKDYPYRLKDIPDRPICLFVQGNGDIDSLRTVAVVGSRKCSGYGRDITERVIEEIRQLGGTVISGLAYGVDSIAHTACLSENVPTFGVLGHGLDRIYPKEHYELAQRMQLNGGLITEYFTNTTPRPSNFPARNRIIAALSDLVIVTEASKTGGALLTARLANDYNREVIAIPGRLGDVNSEGCNFLIETNQAHSVYDISSVGKLMNWEKSGNNRKEKHKSGNIPVLSDIEKKIYVYIQQKGEIDIDSLSVGTGIPVNDISSLLLNMELNDAVVSKPGKIYTVK